MHCVGNARRWLLYPHQQALWREGLLRAKARGAPQPAQDAWLLIWPPQLCLQQQVHVDDGMLLR
jgi:hypothetical protein